jgi:hypothetical protein
VTVECTVTGRGGDLTAVLSGRLTLADAPALRLRLFGCLADQPAALVVDLDGMSVGDVAALSVFQDVVRQAARWPGTMVLVCGPYGAYPNRELAWKHARLHRSPVPSISDAVVPATGAARRGRTLATDACLRWALPTLIGPAGLITSELVSNVLDHVAMPGTLRIALWPERLSVAVRDLSAAPPRRRNPQPDVAGGRGLLLVATVATEWGWLPLPDGKVVWATLTR